ncbi:hypothetical protein ACS4RR_021150 [Rhizobium sp. Z1P35]
MKPECLDIVEDHLGSFFDEALAYPQNAWNIQFVLDHFKERPELTGIDIDNLFEHEDRRGLADIIESASFVSRVTLGQPWSEATRWKADGGTVPPISREIR